MKNKSTVAKITEYMELGHPLNQAFVIEAVSRYAKQITDNKEQVRQDMANTFINGDAWVQCAEQWETFQ